MADFHSFYIILCVYSAIAIEIFVPQPRIETEDGHLIFRGAKHRNISLVTEGSGKIQVNGVDLQETADQVRSASNILNRYTTYFQGSFNKIDRFDRALNGKNGVMERLLLLENVTRSLNATSGSVLSNSKITRLNRKLKAAQDYLRAITALLTKDECQSNPCANGGVCQDIFNDFICHCPNEWEGRLCDKDVNECARFVGTDLGCQNGATCINKRGSYQCLCPHGWFGIHCTRRSKDCNSGSSSELCGHGTCVSQNTELGYTCICEQGWTTDGSSATCSKDVDECKQSRSTCSVNPLVACVNTPGSFRCGACPAGYTGNGYYCVDINECELFNGGCSLNPKVDCINTIGSRKCAACPPGFIGDGITCSYRGICNINNGGCHSSATCRQYPGMSSNLVECVCPPGYTGNGMGENGCTFTSFSVCSPNPCKNGICTMNSTSPQGYTCKCTPPFFGQNCDSSLDACSQKPCKNGGVCVNVGFTFRCACTGSWVGRTCETETTGCGGFFREKSGFLKYPPSNSSVRSGSRSCAWVIETSNNLILNITFKQFHLKYTAECTKDWMQIHDGRNLAAHNLGRYCGDDTPGNGSIRTTHNTIYIWYRTDGLLRTSGFAFSWNSINSTCNQNISVTSHGTLQSPGSPGKYPNNRDCFWLLAAPPAKRLLFHFFSFDIGNSENCTGDYLEFYPTMNQKDNPFAKYCNSSTLPLPIYSPGPELMIHFHSDGKGQNYGFQISYAVVEGTPGCGGMFTSDHGEIRSPSYSGKYLADLDCVYRIKLADRLRLKLEFISFDLEFEKSCTFDYLEIYEGPDTNSPLIGRYCGKNIPAPYVSEGNEITLHFKTDWATEFEGFVLQYETVCGGKFTDPSGIIQSDGYPSNYVAGLHCLYEIIQPLGHIIKLTFMEFDLEQYEADDDECFDYVEIRDGDNENSTLIGTFCGKTTPPPIISSLNSLWIKFISDESIGSKGFLANYSTTDIGCGGILKDKVGTISSPGSNDNYNSNLHCIWVIAAPPGNIIQLTWVTFQIEQKYICAHDYVRVYDNNTISGRGGLVGTYCGNKLPPSMLSTSNIVTIVFVTDEYGSNTGGFTMSYNFINEAKACGGNFHSPGGVMRSPGYPKPYPINSDCVWTITVQPGHQILLNVSNFQIGLHTDCKYDALEIRNGKTSSSPLIGRFCGKTIPKLIWSHSNQLHIRLKSEMYAYGAGFEIIWESSATGCGGVLTAPTGSITSPNYPELYNKFTDCYWKISVNVGSLIQIIFTDLDLEPHSHCLLDFVEVFDGSGASSKSLGRFCGATNPSVIRSTQNQVFIYFKSDISLEGRGFQLQYSSVCQNSLHGFYGVIESPNFPDKYPLAQECSWNITVEAKNKINITFSDFNLLQQWYGSRNQSCNSNYLEILYAEDMIFESYGKYCGQSVPKFLTLDHDFVQIRYSTDSSMIGTGFRLEWILEGCGGKLFKEGSIKSPNYPKAYPKLSACRWELETDLGYIIEISFTDIDLERTNACDYDAIKVFNGPDNTYPLLAHFCQQDNPIKISSIGNKMSVYFVSDISYQGRGFTANFTSIKAHCGGKMSIREGTIFSPNYPNNYDKNDTCEWLLEVDENHLIEIEFEDVQLLTNQMFHKNNFVKVYDGPTAAYPVLATITGNKKPNKTITSTHNTLFVEFKSYRFLTSKGFKARFYKACGSRIVASDTGNIQMHPEFIDATRIENCNWTILAPDLDGHISLTFNFINNDCAFAPLMVYDGETSAGTIVGQFCGEKTPPTITSSGHALHISTSSQSRFFATYASYSSRCGGVLSSFEGNFATPGYPGSYPYGNECEWTLRVAPGNHISLSFPTFDIPQSEKCELDFLEIRQANSSGKIIGVYCGNSSPDNVTNLGSLWLYFKSSKIDGSVALPAKGFIAEYVLDHDNEIDAPSGEIGNPLYPDYFRTYGQYSWRVSVGFSKRIVFEFKELNLESFDTEDCSTSSGLTIYDGYDTSASILKHICGYNIPDPIETTSNQAYLEAALDSSRTGSKFLLQWKEFTRYILPSVKNNSVEGCGSKEIIDLNGLKSYILKSPGYPYGYTNNLNCEWSFTTTSTNHLTIEFTVVDLESFYGPFPTCFFDYIAIYSKKDDKHNWEEIRKVCNTNETDSPISVGNSLKVKFVTNYMSNGTGFSAEIREACGGAIQDSEGLISFDSKHIRGRKCDWNITVREGRTIQIDFPMFNISPGQESGCKNYLMMRNGIFSDSPVMGQGQYCGTRGPILNTTGNELNVKYLGTPNAVGFILHFKETSYDCGGTINLNVLENSTIITTPNYPNVPSPHIDCVWIIRAPPASSIQIDFQERFDLTPDDDCSLENVEIRNGATEFSPMIGRFCNSIPSTQFSTDNMMYVKFFTNVDDPRNGFKAIVSLAKCGGTVRGTTGKINWSSLSKGVAQNQNCTFRIVAPQDYYLTLKFDEVYFRINFLSCDKAPERISVYTVDNIQKTESLVETICSHHDLHDISINGNEVIIRFVHAYSSLYRNSKNIFSISYNATKQNCTYNLNTASGVIRSPGYPQRILSFKSCKWTIQVPEGRRITLKFNDLDLDETLEFQDQGLAFLDNLIGRRYLGFVRSDNETTKQIVFKSSSNSMIIYFWSVNAHGRGFSARYTSEEETICKGSFNEVSGSIIKPNETSFMCSWKRNQTYSNKTLKVSLEMHMSFKPFIQASCRSSAAGLKIFSEGTSRLLQFDLCENTTSPVIFRSPFPKLELQVWERKTFNFSLNYDTYDCGGIKTDEIGWIATPNFPNKPTTSLECSWLLKLPAEHQINMTFASFGLGDNCNESFVEIFNGITPRAPKIGKFCKNDKPADIISERNALLIYYHFTQDSKGNGFNLTYQPVIKGCGGIYHTRSRVIQTPQFPSDYPRNAECVWEIRASEGYHVVLSFIDRFHVEESDQCANDYIKVWDWRDDRWYLMNTLCGRVTPNAIKSTSNIMKIMFRSNDKLQARGFKAQWEFKCGGKFEAGNKPQYIVSPGYPLKYPNKIKCVYEIKARESENVGIQFIDFELERGMPSCSSDNVTLEGSGLYYRPIRNIYCGDVKPPPIQFKELIKITFMTDNWVVDRGFRFSFNAIRCGDNITSPTKITLPDFSALSSFASNDLRCFWNITAPKNKLIVLRFEAFQSQYSASCSYGNVAIYSGSDVNYQNKIATLCGNLSESLPTIHVPNNTASISTYESPSQKDLKLIIDIFFTAGPAEGCGGTFNLTSTKVIQAPSINEIVDCTWYFTAPADNQIEFKFIDLNIPSCDDSRPTCASIEFRDGGSSLSPLISKCCFSNITEVSKYQTSSRYGFVRYHIKHQKDNATFRLSVKPIPSICGKTILNVTKETQVLTSPNYPNPYPENIRCRWLLRVHQEVAKIVLKFKDFELSDEGSVSENSCKYDVLEIEDGHHEYERALGPSTIFAGRGKTSTVYSPEMMGVHTFCGRNDKPFEFYSTSIDLTLILQSKYRNNRGKGFKLEYYIAGCNQNYTSNSGKIDFTLNNEKNCIIGVTVAKNRTIAFYFSRFSTFYSENCTASSLKIIDGDLRTGKEVASWCGYNLPTPIFSKTNMLWLKMQSPKTPSIINIALSYTSTEGGRGCGGSFYEVSGIFSSPLYPSNYRNDNICTWTVRVPKGSHVVFWFTTFDLQGLCDVNYVNVTTYEKGLANIHKFCRQDEPATLRSEEKLIVTYQASVSNGGRGWTAEFKTGDRDGSQYSYPLILD